MFMSGSYQKESFFVKGKVLDPDTVSQFMLIAGERKELIQWRIC